MLIQNKYFLTCYDFNFDTKYSCYNSCIVYVINHDFKIHTKYSCFKLMIELDICDTKYSWYNPCIVYVINHDLIFIQKYSCYKLMIEHYIGYNSWLIMIMIFLKILIKKFKLNNVSYHDKLMIKFDIFIKI
jgi:hypothetical protein